MPSELVGCDNCGKQTPPRYQRASGWIELRSGGGTHALIGQKTEHKYLCDECIHKVKAGLSLGQESLL